MRTLLAYGDSNTHGKLPMERLGDNRRLGPEARWPGVAAAALAPDWRVVEEGLPGRTTVHADPVTGLHKNGIAFLPAALESHRPIDLVVLMLGTNDLKARFNVPAVEVALGVENLVVAIKGSAASPEGGAPAVLLVAPPRVLETGCMAEIYAGASAKSARLGGLFAEVAARQGAAFLDAAEVIESDPLDGIHFGAEAHAALGRAVAEAVRRDFG